MTAPTDSSSSSPSTPTVSELPKGVQYREPSTLELAAKELGHDPNHTHFDRGDMLRLGKRQEFKRVFGKWATFGFTSMYLLTWEYLICSIAGGLVNGGFGGLVYEYIFTVFAFGSVVLTMAEMASMAPTSGGQYHWVSEFAPARYQKHLSYAAGWTSALGWLTGNASGFFIMSTLVEALVEVYKPDFTFTNWQAVLVMCFFLINTIYFNTLGAKLLPSIEIVSMVFHFGGFIVTIVALWVLCPKNSTAEVFTNIVNQGGWSSAGVSFLVGHITILFSNLGPDAAVHIAEEIKDAGTVLPQTMVWSYALNAALGFVMLITILYTGGSLDDALNAASPFQDAFTNTGVPGLNFALTLILALLIASGNITSLATTSREVWAFARDGGLPFHSLLSKVWHRYNIPFWAIIVTSFLSFCLCLINLGSNVAFNIIISLNLIAFLGTYLLSIGCLITRRLRPDPDRPLPHARWSLGRMGLPINIFAFCYSAIAMVFACFPEAVPVDPTSANWGPVIWAGTLLIALISYVLQGRRIYKGPVAFVEGVRREGEELQKAE